MNVHEGRVAFAPVPGGSQVKHARHAEGLRSRGLWLERCVLFFFPSGLRGSQQRPSLNSGSLGAGRRLSGPATKDDGILFVTLTSPLNQLTEGTGS